MWFSSQRWRKLYFCPTVWPVPFPFSHFRAGVPPSDIWTGVGGGGGSAALMRSVLLHRACASSIFDAVRIERAPQLGLFANE